MILFCGPIHYTVIARDLRCIIGGFGEVLIVLNSLKVLTSDFGDLR